MHTGRTVQPGAPRGLWKPHRGAPQSTGCSVTDTQTRCLLRRQGPLREAWRSALFSKICCIWWVHYTLCLRGASALSVMEMLPLSFVQSLWTCKIRAGTTWTDSNLYSGIRRAAARGSQRTWKCFVTGHPRRLGSSMSHWKEHFPK